jgi:hypothetical protein
VEEAAAELGERIMARPGASVVLSRLLRLQRRTSTVEPALLAYSTLLGGPEFRRWLAGRPAGSGSRPPDPEPPGPSAAPARSRDQDGELHLTLVGPHGHNAFVFHVHGPCMGAGIEIPAAAGRVEAAPETSFRLPELSMGLLPGTGGTGPSPGGSDVAAPAISALPARRCPLRRRCAGGLVDRGRVAGGR